MKLGRGQFSAASKSMKNRPQGSRAPAIVFLLIKWWGQPNVIDLNEYRQIRAARTRWGLPWRK